MKESNIIHENGRCFVLKEKTCYTVCISGPVHAVSDSAYTKDADGLSIAKARADWLATRDVAKIYRALIAQGVEK